MTVLGTACSWRSLHHTLSGACSGIGGFDDLDARVLAASTADLGVLEVLVDVGDVMRCRVRVVRDGLHLRASLSLLRLRVALVP